MACKDVLLPKADCGSWWLWNFRLDPEAFWVHVRSALTNAFAVSMSLRITATIATFAGFPAAHRPSYFALRSGLNRMAISAGI